MASKIEHKADVKAKDGVLYVENTSTEKDAGYGILAKSHATAIRATGQKWAAIVAETFSDIGGPSVWGEHQNGGVGVYGRSMNGQYATGVFGQSVKGTGVLGRSEGPGVVGESKTWIGVYGVTEGDKGTGVTGEHKGKGSGVMAVSKDGCGLFAVSTNYEAVHATTNSAGFAAVAAYNDNPQSNGAAVYAKKAGDHGWAGFFEGNVHVTKDISLANADCAEDFDVADPAAAEPGTVMVLDEAGTLRQSTEPYDRRVAGIVSGAGTYRPALVLDKQNECHNRRPLALIGKVFCKVDATTEPVRAGDLLTASPIPGHAMKASDRERSFGAVIGKALGSLPSGCGLVPVLVALQ